MRLGLAAAYRAGQHARRWRQLWRRLRRAPGCRCHAHVSRGRQRSHRGVAGWAERAGAEQLQHDRASLAQHPVPADAFVDGGDHRTRDLARRRRARAAHRAGQRLQRRIDRSALAASSQRVAGSRQHLQHGGRLRRHRRHPARPGTSPSATRPPAARVGWRGRVGTLPPIYPPSRSSSAWVRTSKT